MSAKAMGFYIAISGDKANHLVLEEGRLVPFSDAPASVRKRSLTVPDLGGPSWFWDDGGTNFVEELVSEGRDRVLRGGKLETTALGRLMAECDLNGLALRVWSSFNDVNRAYGEVEPTRSYSEVSEVMVAKTGAMAPVEFVYYPDSAVALSRDAALPWLPLIKRFDAVIGSMLVPATVPPSQASLAEIRAQLGIDIPAGLLAFACYSKHFSDFFLSLGSDFNEHQNILRTNKSIRSPEKPDEATLSLPENLVIITECFMADHFWCFDLSQTGPDYPVVYWCPIVDPAEYPDPYPDFTSFITAQIEWYEQARARQR